MFVVTNHRAMAHGLLTEPRLDEIHRVMLVRLADAGAHIGAVYHCPHKRGMSLSQARNGHVPDSAA